MFLIKEREPACQVFDDEEWTARTPLEDVPENSVVDAPALTPVQPLDAKGVRPIQMGEFLRKYVSKRLLSLNSGGIANLMTSARQLGVGTSGGAEALAFFHQFLFDE